MGNQIYNEEQKEVILSEFEELTKKMSDAKAIQKLTDKYFVSQTTMQRIVKIYPGGIRRVKSV